MHGENFPLGGSKKRCCRAVALLLAGTAFLTTLSGCKPSDTLHPTTTPATETVPTEPPATIPPDGNPEDVTCKGTYTVDLMDGSQVVATIEDQQLNNSKLNILYRLAINGYKPREGQPSPDFSKPLDSQECPLDGNHITWQQYFLQKAIDAWQAIQSLERRSYMPMVTNEVNFEVDPVKHATYMTDMPINDGVLYDEDASFRLTRKEKPYMDKLPETMKKLATDLGYGSLREMVETEFGTGIPEKDFQDLVYLANYAYFYFTSVSYDPKPTEEGLNSIIAAMPPEQGELVDMRHILLYSDDATVGADGKVSDSPEGWEKTRKNAEFLENKFHTGKRKNDVGFSVLAHDYTRDKASKATGGMYTNIRKGQMIDPLDQWLFDPARTAGDVGIVKSDYGYHVLYLTAKKDIRTPEAEKRFRAHHMQLILEEAKYNYPMTLDYSQIQLLPTLEQGQITMDRNLLYSDIGHERFPEVPVYIQQDYMKAPYGGYKVSSHGCGISAFAMLSTYMMDEVHTPASLALQFGHYNGLHGTDWKMFTEAPPELGYHLYKRSNVWKDVEEGLKNNRMAITLQVKGYFTRAGHYLVISELLDDGKVVIRDSNIFNYGRLKEHKEDKFNHKKLLPNSQGFWIYEEKVVTVPTCSRCGNHQQDISHKLFKNDDYLCHKCVPAMSRRAVFMDLCRFR